MNQSLLESVQSKYLKQVPDIKTGYTVKVYQKIKEGEKERIQAFEGLVISVKGVKGLNQTITVRKVVSGVGVEKIFPVHSATVEKIEVIKIAKVRRAKLYYMRERAGKSARLKETYINEDHAVNAVNKMVPAIEETPVEEVAAEAEAPTEAEAPEVTETPEAEKAE